MNNNSLLFKHQCIRTLLDESSADAFLFISRPNIIWSIGIAAADGFVIITRKQITLLIDKRCLSYCKKHLNKKIKVVPFESINSIKQVVKSNKIKKLIIENDYMTFKQYEQFIKPLGIEVIRLDTKEVRSIKCEEEIKYLQKAADIAVHALEETRKWIKIGVSESEVKTYLHNLMVSKGASGDSFDLIVAFGKNTANPHHIATNDKLKNNQFVTLDIGCTYNNYCSDITRTFFVGNKPTKPEKEIYNLILNAQQLGLKSAKVGTSGKDLDATVRNYISKNKRFGKLFIHGLGHGVGIEIHESPSINPKYDKMLSNNSVITIEPGVYEDNFAGIRIEDTIVISNKGIINLTKKAKKDFYK